VLGKKGLVGVSSDLATAVRSVVALALSWALVLVSGAGKGLTSLSGSSILFLMLSGVSTGLSWILYFRALKVGRVTQVVAVDRMSLLFTGVFAILFFGEISNLPWKVFGLGLVILGTLILVGKVSLSGTGFAWLWPALGSLVFAVATTLLSKIGLDSVDSILATALRTIVVVVFAVLIAVSRGKSKFSGLSAEKIWFLVLSGLATGASWICYFGALKLGQVSVVAPIDKLSIVFAAVLGYFVLGEKISKREFLGLAVVVTGSLSLIA
jgi:transporter family protein